jgi:two-component system, cell cycle sensor histidine kinase and response regulator CckA
MKSSKERAKTDSASRARLRSLVSSITERIGANDAWRESGERYRRLFEVESDAILVVEADTRRIVDANPAALKLYGYCREELLLLAAEEISAEPEKTRAAIAEERMHVLFRLHRKKDGTVFPVEIAGGHYVTGEHKMHVAAIRDITERKTLEVKLQQAAKMEAVGRLAGGVAHDFNNLLTIINGYSEMALAGLASGDPAWSHLAQIKEAGERAASLTRQLLAFSRQQVLAPRVLDLNNLVSGVAKMLRRLIGEDIELAMVRDSALGRVNADPGQMEQILVNLAVNARDAMPEGGKLVIETANVELGDTYAARHAVVTPGRYVMLAVTDTGIGMDAETQAHIFEPFFTTKERGRGTGLGLAIVYGAVKQSGGYVWVYSEPEQGTAFKIYLPRVEEVAEQVQSAEVPGRPVTGSETILLVEDEKAVRALVIRVLQNLGYNVLSSASPEDALQIGERHPGPIDLLLTDVVLPGMNGRKVADNLASLRPQMKVLYMSGYTDYAVARHGVLEANTIFLQKPFTPTSLARKVRAVLDAGREQSS